MAKTLSEKLIDLPADPEKLQEEEQVKLIRSLDRKQHSLKAQLDWTKKQLKQAEEEIDQFHHLEELTEFTREVSPLATHQQPHFSPEKGGRATGILCWTDWHVEENIEADTVNHLNEYNLDIAEARIKRLVSKSLRLLDSSRSLSNIEDLVLWLGGDLINGYIHEELQESNFLGPAEAICWVQDRVAECIDTLLKETSLPITVVTSMGNHGRSTKKMPISTAYKTSWEWLFYRNLAQYYRNEPRLGWRVENGYHTFVDIQKHPVRFHHGNALRYQGGVGGISIPVNKAIAQWNKSKWARYDIFGHWHQFMYNWNWLCVGSLCGYNAYTISIKGDYQPPTQAFVVMDQEHGPVMTLPIFVEPDQRNIES